MATPTLEDAELAELRDTNQKLKTELQQLSDDLDRMARRRNHKKKGKYGDAESQLHMAPEVRLLIKRNEELRRERVKVLADIQHSDTARRIHETRDALHAIHQKIAEVKAEIRSQKNVNKAREAVVATAQAEVRQLNYLKDAHRQELNDFREEWHQLDEERKALDKQAIAAQVKMHLIQEKLKLGITGDDVAELRHVVADQEAEIESVQTSWARQTMDVHADEKKERGELAKDRAEKALLQARIDELKDALKARERELRHSYQVASHQPGRA